MDQLLFEGEITLEKMQGKGGWTYALLPAVIKGGKIHFGWTRVNAFIDGYEMRGVSLMPIKGGRLFLAVKAAVRKQIKKEAGDTVKIALYIARPTETITEADFFAALADEPAALRNFESFSQEEKNAYLSRIFADKHADAIVERMAAAINNIAERRSPRLPGDKK